MKYFPQYVEYVKTLGYVPETVTHNKRHLQEFKAWIKKLDERNIIREDIQQYIKYLQTCPIQKITLIEKARSIRRYFAYLVRQRYLFSDPCRNVEFPKGKRYRPKDILTMSEVRMLLDIPNLKNILGIRDKAILEILYSTGIRATELCGINLRDINLKDKEIYILKSKNQRERIVPLGTTAKEAVENYLQESRKKLMKKNIKEQALFLGGWKGKRIKRHGLNRMIHQYIQRTGITKKINPHCLRHNAELRIMPNRIKMSTRLPLLNSA